MLYMYGWSELPKWLESDDAHFEIARGQVTYMHTENVGFISSKFEVLRLPAGWWGEEPIGEIFSSRKINHG